MKHSENEIHENMLCLPCYWYCHNQCLPAANAYDAVPRNNDRSDTVDQQLESMVIKLHISYNHCQKPKDSLRSDLRTSGWCKGTCMTEFLSLMRMRFRLYVVEKKLLAIPREWFGIDNRPV